MSVLVSYDPVALLRSATRAAHRRLESMPGLGAATVSLPRYGALLERVAAFHLGAAHAMPGPRVALSFFGCGTAAAGRRRLTRIVSF